MSEGALPSPSPSPSPPPDDSTSGPPSPGPGSEEDEPPRKVRRISSTEEADGETCPICLECWDNSGEHRLVALRCGHLFGAQCVKRWLKAQRAPDRCCPTCKTKANVRDLRHIYARRLVAADTSQITSLQQQIDRIQAEKTRAELELQKTKIAHRACLLQLEGLRSLMRAQVPAEPPHARAGRRAWRFALEKNLEVCRDGGCRVLAYNCRTYELYVSQRSANTLFPGYGIRKVNVLDNTLGQFLHLHPKPIRDMTYSQPRDQLLTVGLDGAARVVERGVPGATIGAGVPLWSCSWDYLRRSELFVGGVGGVIRQYDVRNCSTHLQALTAPGDMSPVVSLASTEFGLLSCQLNSAWLWGGAAGGGAGGRWEPRALPVEGSLMSLCYDAESRRAAVSCRPGGAERCRLAVCRLRAGGGGGGGGEAQVELEETFGGSARCSVLVRAGWVRAADAAWLAAHSESEAALHLHGVDGGATVSLPAAAPTLDVAALHLPAAPTLLAALSDCRLKLYKAVATDPAPT